MLDKLKLLLGISDAEDIDDLLVIMMNLCKEEAYTYCNLPEYDSKLDYIVIQMVIERFNRIGSEGAVSQSSSGVTWPSTIPAAFFHSPNVLSLYRTPIL